MVQLPTITLQPIKKKAPLPIRILTSPKTTLALAGILGAIAFPATALGIAKGVGRLFVPKTLRGAAGTIFAAGILTGAPGLIKFITPKGIFEKGKVVGPIIEDPSLLLPGAEETLGEKIKDVAITAGLGAAAVAALVGAASVIAKAAKKLKPGVPGLPGLPGFPGAPGLPAAPTPVISQPFGPVKKPEPERLKEILPARVPDIKIINKPEINISFRKSRKFINQQLLIR